MTEWETKGIGPRVKAAIKFHPDQLKPKKGAIAICGIGTVGVITSDGPVPVKYLDGNEGVAWTGIHLGFGIDGKDREVHVAPGDMWSSKRPIVIAESIESLLEDANIIFPKG